MGPGGWRPGHGALQPPWGPRSPPAPAPLLGVLRAADHLGSVLASAGLKSQTGGQTRVEPEGRWARREAVCSPPGLGLEFVFVEVGLGQSVVSLGDKGRLATREVEFLGPGFPGCDANPVWVPSAWAPLCGLVGLREPGTPMRTAWCVLPRHGPQQPTGSPRPGQPPRSSGRLMLACQEATIRPQSSTVSC